MRQTIISRGHLNRFSSRLFETGWQKAAHILSGILKAGSTRLSEISQHMEGNPEANYKAIERFLKEAAPRVALKRLFLGCADLVVVDPVEIERPQAYRSM